MIWIYVVVDSNPQPGSDHYPLNQAACGNWKGLTPSDYGRGGLLVRAVIAGNLTDYIFAPTGDAPGGVMNVLAGGNIGGAIDSGTLGVCNIRALGSIVGTAVNLTIESAAGVGEVRALGGDIRANVRALNGSITVIDASNGNIGNVSPIPVQHEIIATSGIGSIICGGSLSANITAGTMLTDLNVGTDYRGTMNLAGFTTFHIGRDLLGIVNLTNSLPADRLIEIDRSTGANSQINIQPSAGLLGQIDINRANSGGIWQGTVNVGTTAITGPGYTNTANSLGGGAVDSVPFRLHDESCTPPNGAVSTLNACTTLTSVKLRHYGFLSWNPSTIAVQVYRRPACTGTYTQVTGSSFAIDANDGRTLTVSPPGGFEIGYEYKIQPNGVLQCATPGNPSVIWDGDYIFRIKSNCAADVSGGSAIPDGLVNVNDLLAVINAWGSCGVPSCCPADITGDGTVNVNDLLAVINTWGLCEGCTGDSESMPQSVQDCMDKCSNAFPEGGTEWSQCVDDCVRALCEAQIINCD